MKRLLFLCCFLAAVSLSAHATTYYVCAATGSPCNASDSNAGTSKTATWLHAPGMANCTGTCASTTPQPGDNIIFRGGDTWHFGNSSASPYVGACSSNHCWTWSWNGSSGHPIYIGVDLTWYAGGSFARPVFNGDNPVTNSSPSTCTVRDYGGSGGSGGYNVIFLGTHSHLRLDNIEMTGFCLGTAGSISAGMVNMGATDTIVENMYFHGYTLATTATDDELYAIQGGSATGWKNDLTNICENNVFDNSDGTFGNVGSWPNHNVNAASMGAIQNTCAVVAYNIFNRVDNGIVGTSSNVHDNLFHDLYEPSTSNHGNIWNSNNATGSPNTCTLHPLNQSFYNNVFYNIDEGVGVWMEPCAGTGLVYNNIEWNVFNGVNGLIIGTGKSYSAATIYVYNNTFDYYLDSNNLYFQVGGIDNGSDPGFNGTMFFSNTHMIGAYTGLTSGGTKLTYCQSGAICTFTDNGGELIQSEGVANGQGYTKSNAYAPTLSTNSTVGTGVNQETLISTLGSAYGFGTSAGCTETSGSGGQISSCPAVALNPRQATAGSCTAGVTGCWDRGAYMLGNSAGSFTCSPATVPANHSGHIVLTCTGVGTSWNGSTTFTVGSPATLVSTSNSSSTSETVTITTSSGTGSSTITDTTDSISTTITVSTATLAISPTSGAISTTPTLSLTGTNTLWLSETASGLFSESGGTGASIGTPTVTSNTAATAVLTVGSATGTETIEDTSTTATATFTATGGTLATPTFSPAGGSTVYVGPQVVTITCASGATCCYTLDGTTPTATSGSCTHGTTYTIPFLVSDPLTLHAIASENLFTNSAVGSAGYLITDLAQLPTTAVNNNEAIDGTTTLTTYELSLPSTWVVGPPASCMFHTPYWSGSPTFAGLQSAVNDIEACRTSFGHAAILDIPPALYTTSNALGLVIPQSSTTLATQFNILRSTQDSHLPNGTVVCSHGIQDNLATSTDIGLDNPDCAGDALTYQLGTTVTSVPTGAITLANGMVTNSSAYDDVQYMYTLESSGTNPASLTTCSPVGTNSTSVPPKCAATSIAPDHWLIEDAEIRMQAGNTGAQNIVNLVPTFTETSTTQLPTHIHFRKLWVHGDWTSLAAGFNDISDGMEISCVYCSVLDSQFSQLLRPGAEGHVILTGMGEQLKINHNWAEGQSIGMFAGGFSGSGPSISGLVPHSDVEERRNRWTFPWTWLGVGNIPSGHWAGSSVVRKNADEIKSGQRILRAGNILENIDGSGGQSGVNHDIKIENSSTGVGSNYNDTTTDVSELYNIFRNDCLGGETVRSVAGAGNGGGSSPTLNRINSSYNLYYNESPTNFGCTSVNSGFLFDSGGLEWQGTVTENAFGTGATFVANCSIDQGGCIGQIGSGTVNTAGTGCVNGGAITVSGPNLAGGYPASATTTCSGGGISAVNITVPGSGYTSVTGTPANGTGTVTLNINASSTAPTTGAQVININVGDPVSIRQCSSVTAFNSTLSTVNGKQYPNVRGPLATVGSTAWTGTPTTGNLSVTYPWTATANASDTAGYCKLTQVQGGPENFVYTHNTVVSAPVTQLITSGNSVTQPPNGPNYALNNNWRDSIFIGGPMGNSQVGSGGNAFVNFNLDSTTLTIDHDAWVGQSSFTAYCNNPFYPCATPAMFFGATTGYCTGASPTSSCVGFTGSEYYSASSMVIAPADYHDLALNSGSIFAAGNTNQASDGTNLGANISLFDYYQTLNQWSGFYPDTLPPSSATPTSPNPVILTWEKPTKGLFENVAH